MYEHHKMLNHFCGGGVDDNRSMDGTEKQQEVDEEGGQLNTDAEVPYLMNQHSTRQLTMSFEQYCLCVHTLSTYATATQQFECMDLFQTYTLENESGISRTELVQLLQEHYHAREHTKGPISIHTAKVKTDARYFERLYTWLKKHIPIYDRAHTGYLPLNTTLEMLQTHPDALYHFQFQFEPYIRKLDENNKHYREKVQAASLPGS